MKIAVWVRAMWAAASRTCGRKPVMTSSRASESRVATSLKRTWCLSPPRRSDS